MIVYVSEMEAKLLQLQKEVAVMKRELQGIRKKLNRPILEPIIIEPVSEREMTAKERKREREAIADFRAGRTGRFVTLDEAKKTL